MWGIDSLVVTPPPTSRPVSPPARYLKRMKRCSRSPVSRPRLSTRGWLRGKKLFGGQQHTRKQDQPPVWTKAEESKLIEFMLLFTEGKSWVMHKHIGMWQESIFSDVCKLFTVNQVWFMFTLHLHSLNGSDLIFAFMIFINKYMYHLWSIHSKRKFGILFHLFSFRKCLP